MDELGVLLEKLAGEVDALEAAVDSREADEARQLGAWEARLEAAESRLSKSRTILEADNAALAALEIERTQLLQRIDGWRGQLWRLGHGIAATALVTVAVVPLAVAIRWLGAAGSFGLVGLQLVLLLLGWFLIPEKR